MTDEQLANVDPALARSIDHQKHGITDIAVISVCQLTRKITDNTQLLAPYSLSSIRVR